MTADLIGTHEAATRLAVSVRTVHRLVAHGRLTPAAKVPGATGAYLFHPDHVAAVAGVTAAAGLSPASTMGPVPDQRSR